LGPAKFPKRLRARSVPLSSRTPDAIAHLRPSRTPIAIQAVSNTSHLTTASLFSHHHPEGTSTFSSTMTTQDAAPLTLLYSDKYVDIYENKIAVKGFYFPWGEIGYKNINMDDVESVHTGSDLNLSWYELKQWGRFICWH
jgi:hypothetical protein